MTVTLSSFGSQFDTAFHQNTNKLNPGAGELALFRALKDTLSSFPGAFRIEEYHGGRYQVTFTGDRRHARHLARCELGDLMIVTYSSHKPEIRLTYLQAKFERHQLGLGCRRLFDANLEQWFLLRKRPRVSGYGTFNPPADLLQSALLDSVGSFVFFFKDTNKAGFQCHYASASYLQPIGTAPRRYGKVQLKGPCRVHLVKGYKECLAACSNQTFAQSLYDLQIGTPLDPVVQATQGTRDWLAGHLSRLIGGAQGAGRLPPPLATDLLERLRPSHDFNREPIRGGSFGARALVILQSDSRSVNETSR